MSLLEIFCDADDFWQAFFPFWLRGLITAGDVKRIRQTRISMSEMMTIIIHFHQSHYRYFKAFYIEHVQVHLRSEFPDLVSYNRFVELMP